jgi:hypothetical protein
MGFMAISIEEFYDPCRGQLKALKRDKKTRSEERV